MSISKVSLIVPTGLGFGICSTIATVQLGAHFDKYRNAAFGIVATGAGLGLMLFAPMLNVMLDMFTWRETILIVSGILMNLYVCAAIMYLVDGLNKRHAMQHLSDVESIDNKCTEEAFAITVLEKQPLNGPVIQDANTGVSGKLPTEELNSHTKSSQLKPKYTDAKSAPESRMSGMPFIVYLFSLFLINTGMSATYLHFPVYISSTATFQRASLLLSIMGFGNICGRLGFGFFTNKFKSLLIPTFVFSCILTGVAMVLVPYIGRVLIGQCLFSIVFSSFGNCFIPLLGSMCIRLVGLENLYMAYGIAGFASGIGQLIGPVFAGKCRLYMLNT